MSKKNQYPLASSKFMERDPRFTEFLEDKLEHYPFAERLMEFCLELSSKPSWEDFIKKSQLPIPFSKGTFSVCYVIFRDRYARGWGAKRSNESMDDALASLSNFRGRCGNYSPTQTSPPAKSSTPKAQLTSKSPAP
jgi:hypothetical protein